MKLFFAILDDDRKLLKFYSTEIESILEKHNIPGEIVCASNNPDQFMDIVKTCKANVCMIDINLQTNTNGIQVAKEIRQFKIPTEIVFITGHLQYMKNAFLVRAFDYLEKPVTTEDLAKCILRLYKEIDIDLQVKQGVIKVKSGTMVYHIPAQDIIYIEHANFKSVILTKDRRIETYESLANIAKELPSNLFRQCHRAIWVNIAYIDSIDMSSSIIKFNNGMECSLGKTFKKEFLDYAL